MLGQGGRTSAGTHTIVSMKVEMEHGVYYNPSELGEKQEHLPTCTPKTGGGPQAAPAAIFTIYLFTH